VEVQPRGSRFGEFVGAFLFSRPVLAAKPGYPMTDDEFLRAFFELKLPNSAFHHRDHVRLAWLAVRRHGERAGEQVVADGIRRFAAAHGHGDRYHDTITRFWVRLVAHAARHAPFGAEHDLDALLGAHPLLLDASAPLRHWSREALFSDEARRAWREADLVALPF
jgi:hypothetical protein